MNNLNKNEFQRQYYARTSNQYDMMHLSQDLEHLLALYLLSGYIEFYKVSSILDVGAGTGNTMMWLKKRYPGLKIIGIEPVAELRDKGYEKGLSSEELIAGDAYKLPFSNNSFDLVCEFAVLHHLEYPNVAINEMSRVTSKMLCISDSNFMGQGSLPVKILKYLIFSFGFWPISNWIKTRGKGYTISEGDGLAYSYSVYQNLSDIRNHFQTLRIMTTKDTCCNNYLSSVQILSAASVFLVGLGKKSS